MAAKEAALGPPLTAAEERTVCPVCTSDHPLDRVVGVAGSGKTSALDVIRQVFETEGLGVLGTSTSGQAARHLDQEAGMPSSMVASLLWRLDHSKVTFDAGIVVILD
jgi:hypothetical protein